MTSEADCAAGMAPGATGDVACAGRPDTVASANSAAAATPRRRIGLHLGSFVPIIVVSPENADIEKRTAKPGWPSDNRDRPEHERTDNNLNAA
jgi:hypothetical protein